MCKFPVSLTRTHTLTHTGPDRQTHRGQTDTHRTDRHIEDTQRTDRQRTESPVSPLLQLQERISEVEQERDLLKENNEKLVNR